MTTCSACQREVASPYKKKGKLYCQNCYEDLVREENRYHGKDRRRRGVALGYHESLYDGTGKGDEHDKFYQDYGQFNVAEKTRPRRRWKS